MSILAVLLPSLASAQILVTVDGEEVMLRDVPADAWFATYVRDAVRSDIVSGYRDEEGNALGLFGPADPVTLAQTLKIVVEGAGYDTAAYASSPPVMTGHWASSYLPVAAEERFRVFEEQQNIDRPATRAEVASLFTDAFDIDTVTPVGNRYDDVGFSTPYAYSIEALSRDGILSGDTDRLGNAIGRFRPGDRINRAEVTKIVMLARAVYGTEQRGSSSRSSASSLSSSFTSSSRSSESTTSASSVSSSASLQSSVSSDSSASSMSSASSVSSVSASSL